MAACRACGEPIRFESTAKGKLQPISIKTGVSHFADCVEAARFKKPATPDNQCHVCGGDSIEREPGVGPHYGKLRCQDCNAWRWQRRPIESQA
jgi:hypothetical protein